MAYRYRNKKTNEVITTTNKVGSKNWEPLEVDEETPIAEEPAEQDASMEEPAEEQAAPEKPKTARRGKK